MGKIMFYSKRGEWENECSTVKEANGKKNVDKDLENSSYSPLLFKFLVFFLLLADSLNC